MGLTLKQLDTYPAWICTLTDSNGAIDLTNATLVKMVGKGAKTGTALGPVTFTVIDAHAGQVSYLPTTADTGTPDIYNVEFAIHWAAGGIQKVPNAAEANPQITIDPDITGSTE